MEEFHELVTKAEQAFTKADHLAYVTMPLLKEEKIMLTITEKINMALTAGIQSLLTYEYKNKKLEKIPAAQEEQLKTFETTLMPKYKISKELLETINQTRSILKQHQKSAVEFTRKKNYFICDDTYKIKKLNLEELKKHLFHTKTFIEFLRRLPC